ncbi:DUF1761 domain-containing protein [Pseudoalteromonas umbrosa]|uniref:DUF1761 domain-containing protein n=1 Tax=Pseudoalteromonas umbrosa TaxID=3048489 RepID=UPI0024C3D387|nr:DUF1761 domain-containing protein [Pseudoalteromonas sp. B95]MDK1287800.1 DUF1761 domain-containing protein [Pseudoalteromonas sp. B95]
MYVYDINIIAVLLAALSSFLLGGIWYSPLLFQRTWLEGAGLTELDLKAANHKAIFLGSFFLSFVASVAVATLVDKGATVIDTMSFGLFIGILFVASSFGVSYLFEQRPLKLFLVNAGYHTLQFTLIGFVIGSLN